MVHQGYIEPHNAIGIYSSDGHATVYCSTQGTFRVRSLTAQVLGMAEGNIKVVPAEIGGGFGGKLTVYLEPLVDAAVQEERPAGEDGDDARRGAARDADRPPAPRSAARWARPRTAKWSPPRSGWPTRRAPFLARRSARARWRSCAAYNIPQLRSTPTTWSSTGPRSRPIARPGRPTPLSPRRRSWTSWPNVAGLTRSNFES